MKGPLKKQSKTLGRRPGGLLSGVFVLRLAEQFAFLSEA